MARFVHSKIESFAGRQCLVQSEKAKSVVTPPNGIHVHAPDRELALAAITLRQCHTYVTIATRPDYYRSRHWRQLKK